MDHHQEKDCTSRCRSSVHAALIQSCVTAATPPQLRAYAVGLCHNFAIVTDKFGRNLLHAAASCGKYEVVEWLLKQCRVDIDIKDHESGWTSLHRSFFYGQLSSARILCMNGASLRPADHEGLTPLDVIQRDRLPYIEYLPSDPADVYAWGSNFNYNLGIGNSQSKNAPEILEVFRKSFIDIHQVQMCKFHSVFLTIDGRVFTCGYGYGGRLGQETEDISLVPSVVKGLGSQPCKQIAAGQDHLILLLHNGQVWSCGLNIYHQLGHIPPSEKVLAPKALSLKFLKGKEVLGVRAARFHSVIYTSDCVFTFGLNAGQLGHPKGDRTQIPPRQVSGLYAEDCKLTHVEVSDGATVCATSRGDVYVLHEYQIRKIASRQLEIQKLSVVGGHLDSRVDVAGVKEGGGLELRVALLTKSGKVYLWRQTDPYLRRCLFTSPKEILVSDLHINHYSMGLITFENEGYLGTVVPFKGKRSTPTPTTIHAPSNINKMSSGLVVLLDTDECLFIKAKKLANIYRATTITSDSKGRNFAVLQSNPKMGLVEVPWLSNPIILQDFARLLSETNIHDDFHDIIIKVEKREFGAHKYILASRCDYFKKQFMKDTFKNGTLVLENTKSDAFEQALKFIYTNSCDFLIQGYEVKWGIHKEKNGKKKSSAKPSKCANPIVILQELCKKLGLQYLAKRLDLVKLIDNRISLSESDLPPDMFFKRHLLPSLSDVNLVSSDGNTFSCHKCILIARLDYFRSMLSTCWAENDQLGQVPLPIPSNILEAVLDYLYSDNSNKVSNSDDVEFLCQTLMFADQLLMPRLKELCEISLVRLITLKNSAELLEIASVYNAVQLKRSCMQFISINLAAIVELKALEVLSDDVMEDLSRYYKDLVPGMQKRKFSSPNAPHQKDLILLEQQCPVSDTCSFEKSMSDSHDNKTKSRRRCSSLRSEAKELSLIKSEIDMKTCNENIVLDILKPNVVEEKLVQLIDTSPEEKETHYSPLKHRSDKQGQWVMKPIEKEQVLSLDKIMLEETKKITALRRKTDILETKPIPHLSQKQKKMMKQQSETVLKPSSPPSRNLCPWAKLPEQSPPSPSFWDSFTKKDFTPSSINRDIDTPTKSLPEVSGQRNSISSPEKAHDVVISLYDIQKDEEQKFRRLINPKIKSLDLINIEDQAIEELSLMYKVHDNPKEKVTVSRVQLEEVLSPIWKRKH